MPRPLIGPGGIRDSQLARVATFVEEIRLKEESLSFDKKLTNKTKKRVKSNLKQPTLQNKVNLKFKRQ